MPFVTLGVLFGELTQDQKEDVLMAVAEQASIRFDAYVDAVVDGVGLRELRGQDKLEAFRQRASEIWARIQTELPAEYDKRMKEWQSLETRALNRQSTHPQLSPTDLRAASESPTSATQGY